MVLFLAAAPVGAIEIFGLRIFEPPADDEVEVLDPLPYTTRVVVDPALAEIEAAVRGASSLVRFEDRPASGSVGLLASARRDYGRIIDALYGVGRYGGTVSIPRQWRGGCGSSV